MNFEPCIAIRGGIILVLACCAAVAFCAETEPDGNAGDSGSGVIEYRRVLAPADREEEWRPVGIPRYIPMAPEDFEEKVARANAASQPLAGNVGACIVAARYEACLEGTTLVRGRATLDVRHTIARATLMPLVPCGLCIADASWADRDGEAARLGLGPDGQVQVLVEQSGRLELDWSLEGRRDAMGGVAFDLLQLPPSAASEIVLELPRDFVPRVDRGIVVADVKSDGPTRRWSIRLGGDNRIRLRIAPTGDPIGHGKLTEVQETLVYEVDENGIEITGRFLLDVLNQPLERLTLLLDAEVRLIAAELDEHDLEWSIVRGEEDHAPRRAVLEMPEPITGLAREVTIRALAPIGPAGPWQLPRIRSQGPFWGGAKATLRVRRPLLTEDFVVDGGRQSGMEQLPWPAEGESIRIQFFEPQATVQLSLAREDVPVELDYGVKVELSAGQITGRFAGQFRIAQGKRFRLEADVARQWVVDAVEADPPEAISDWRLERPEVGPRRLVVELATPLSPQQPIRLAVSGRRLQSPVGQAQKAAELGLVRFRDVRPQRRLMAVDTVEPYRLVLSGDEKLTRLEPQSLDAEQLKLFAEPPQGLIFAADHRVENLAIALARRKPAFSAGVRIVADVSPSVLSETYLVRVVPESARLEHVVVELARRDEAPIRWHLGSGDRVLPAETEDPALERWKIQLSPSRSEPFEFRAVRSCALHEKASIGLMRLPEAARQRGTVAIQAVGPRTPRIENQRLAPLLDELNARGTAEITPARFRYDPEHDVGSPDSVAVVFPSQQDQACPAASIWLAEVTSRYEPSGLGRHVAVWRLRNSGRRTLRVKLPPATDLDHVEVVWVDGVRAAWQAADDGAENCFAVEIDPRRRFCTILVCFTTTQPRWTLTGMLSLTLPEPDAPVLDRRLTLWLPPGWKGLVPTENEPAADPLSDWPRRLFGPIGQSQRHRPWNPFRPGGWNARHQGTASIDKAERPLERFGELGLGRNSASGDQPRTWGWRMENQLVAGYLPTDMTGWTAHQIRPGRQETLQIRVVSEELVKSLGWIALVVATLIVWWLARRGSLIAILLIPLTGIVALAVGEVFVPVATGAFLGTLCGWGFRLISYRPARMQGAASQIVPENAAGAAAVRTVIILLALGISAVVAKGDQPQPIDASMANEPVIGNATPHKPLVFVPVDDSEQPTGDEYYVDELFYFELQRRAAALTGQPRGWLINAATYRAVLSWQTAPDRLALTELRAVFDIEVFGQTQQVRIPLAVGGDQWYPVSVRRDWQEVDPVWDENNGLVLEIDPTDWCRVEVTLGRRQTEQPVSSGFDLAIPPLATSRLRLDFPPDAPEIDVLAARGATVRYDESSRLVAALGPVDRLSVRWPDGTGRGGAARQGRIDELLWLKVERGYVLVEALLQIESPRGQATELAIEVDSRLQQQGPPRVEGARLDQVVDSSGEHHGLVRLKLVEPSEDAIRVHMRFLLRGASGIGNVRLPYFRVVEHSARKRWVGISVDPGLEHEVRGAQETSALSPAEFTKAWGGSPSPLVAAYALDDVSPTWSLATRPRDPKTVIDWALALGVARKQTLIYFDAEVSTTQGYVFQHRIAAPKALLVEEVSVMAEGSQRVLRWSRTPDGTIVVYFNAPVEGEHTLSVRGCLERSDQPISPLPLLRLVAAEENFGVIDVYRDHNARVSLEDVTGLAEVGADVGHQSDRGLGRLQHSFVATRTEPVSAKMRVVPNEPDVRVDQITSLKRQGTTWTARVDFRLEVDRGVIDELQLELPSVWRGPFELIPPMETQWRDEQAGLLILKPRSAIESEWELSITGPLELGPGDPVTVPAVRLKPARLERHRLVLPKQLEFQPISWETQGLRKVPLPQAFANQPGAEGAYDAFVVRETPFRAVPRLTADEPLVHLADVCLTLGNGGECYAVATFDLEAAGQPHALLHMPSGWKLDRVIVSGVTVCPVAAEDATWQVPLSTARLPQRVEIVFRGKLGAEHQHTPIKIPTLIGFPVRQTMITFVGTGRQETVEVAGAIDVTAVEQAMIRLRNIAGLIELGKDATADEPREAVGWYRCWLCRWVAARAEAEREIATTGTVAPRAAVAEIESLGLQQDSLARRQGAEDLWLELAANPAATVDAGALWRQSVGDTSAAVRYLIEAETDTVSFSRVVAARQRPSRQTWVGLVSMLCVFVGIWVAAASGWLARWPAVAGVLAGLAWWLWLWPSVLGIILVLLSLLTSLRFGWKRGRASGSTVVRLRASDG